MTAAAQKIQKRNTLSPFPGGWEAHKHKHCIWAVSPKGYTHAGAYNEVVEAMSGAFEELGGSAPIVRDISQLNGRIPLIYGAHLIETDNPSVLPEGSIIMNLEQLHYDTPWFRKRYVELLKHFAVLDWSPRNCKQLVESGLTHARVLEPGFHKSLHRIRPVAQKDIDVLHYGSMNERRADILNQLILADRKVVHLFDVYGRERDAAIARAKVVINIHAADTGVLETVRTSYLMANSTCVVAEANPGDFEVEPYADGLKAVPYDQLFDAVCELLDDPIKYQTLALKGWDIIRRRPQSKLLKELMDAC